MFKYGVISASFLNTFHAVCCSDILQKLFNNTLSNKEFPDELKFVDIILIHKKGDPVQSKNYRPVSALLVVSKASEKIMHDKKIEDINIF